MKRVSRTVLVRVLSTAGLVVGLGAQAPAMAGDLKLTIDLSLPAHSGAIVEKVVCRRSIDLRALLDAAERDPVALRDIADVRLESIDRAIDDVALRGADRNALVRDNPDGVNAACESACLVLPAHSRVTGFRVSDRNGDLRNGMTMTAQEAGFGDRLRLFRVAQLPRMNYEIAFPRQDGRLLCATAANWDASPSLQRVEIQVRRRAPS